MPSFDIVSELDKHELTNALDQANKEVTTRYDFKGTDSKFDLKETTVTMHTQSDFQLDQMFDILVQKRIVVALMLNVWSAKTLMYSLKRLSKKSR